LDFSFAEEDKDEAKSFIEQIFEALFPLFRFNSNLQVFDLKHLDIDRNMNTYHDDLLRNLVNDVVLA
jgi:hypothetical protein